MYYHRICTCKTLVWDLTCLWSILVMLQIEATSTSPKGQDYAVQSLRASLDQVPRHVFSPCLYRCCGARAFHHQQEPMAMDTSPSAAATCRSRPYMHTSNSRAHGQVGAEEFETDLVQFLEATGERRLAKNVRGKHVGWCVLQLPLLVRALRE